VLKVFPSPEDFMAWLNAIGDTGWLTTAEAAELLGVTPGRLCWLRRHGRTPPNVAVKLSHRYILWAPQELTEWAARRSNLSAEAHP
jgi:hypothetical protein